MECFRGGRGGGGGIRVQICIRMRWHKGKNGTQKNEICTTSLDPNSTVLTSRFDLPFLPPVFTSRFYLPFLPPVNYLPYFTSRFYLPFLPPVLTSRVDLPLGGGGGHRGYLDIWYSDVFKTRYLIFANAWYLIFALFDFLGGLISDIWSRSTTPPPLSGLPLYPPVFTLPLLTLPFYPPAITLPFYPPVLPSRFTLPFQ